jgi:hypothetical protein
MRNRRLLAAGLSVIGGLRQRRAYAGDRKRVCGLPPVGGRTRQKLVAVFANNEDVFVERRPDTIE